MIREQGRLIFDSAQAEYTVGSRAGVTSDRSLSFRSENLSVDLVICADASPLRVMHGQVVHEMGDRPVTLASVRLGDEGEAVQTDEHGQFAVSTLASDSTQFLWIDTPEEQVLCSIPPTGKQR